MNVKVIRMFHIFMKLMDLSWEIGLVVNAQNLKIINLVKIKLKN